METELPYFLITIDTEGDNLWALPKKITTENARFLPRFQRVAEKFGFKPTYLTNYEMANSKVFQKFGRETIKNGNGEIGMHLHAWNSLPTFHLTKDDFRLQPFLINYPETVIQEKITYMTMLLESIFDVKMTSHRAGRWAFNSTYARMLSDSEYLVDTSVTPHFSWESVSYHSGQRNGSSYLNFPETPYALDLKDIARIDQQSSFLEIPLTVTYLDNPIIARVRGFFREGTFTARALNRLVSYPVWLRPDGKNLKNMLSILEIAVKRRWSSVVFMLHSSELMPGGSPNFTNETSIDYLFGDLENLFAAASRKFQGGTLTEFYHSFINGPERNNNKGY